MTEVFCNIVALQISLQFEFEDACKQAKIVDAVSGKVSELRLPKCALSSAPAYEVSGRISITATIISEDQFLVKFGGDVCIPEFLSDFKGFHWDFWRVALCLISKNLLSRGIVTVHAACVGKWNSTYLIPGISGAGKSAISFFSRSQGEFVYASELCFIVGGQVIAGNATMSIDSEAIGLLHIKTVGDEEECDGKLLCATTPVLKAAHIEKIVFPKVSTSQETKQ